MRQKTVLTVVLVLATRDVARHAPAWRRVCMLAEIRRLSILPFAVPVEYLSGPARTRHQAGAVGVELEATRSRWVARKASWYRVGTRLYPPRPRHGVWRVCAQAPLRSAFVGAFFQPHAMCSSRAGQLSFTFMLANLAEPSEPTTARRAASATPASRESSRSPDRPIRARGAKRSTSRLAMCVVATTANPTRGARAARARRIPRSRVRETRIRKSSQSEAHFS